MGLICCKTERDVIDMIESNAAMALDQRHAHRDAIAVYGGNVVDTLRDWGMADEHTERAAADSYYIRVGELLARARMVL